MKQHLTATFIFDPLNLEEFMVISSKIGQLKEAGYTEKLRKMNDEGNLIVKLELEETL